MGRQHFEKKALLGWALQVKLGLGLLCHQRLGFLIRLLGVWHENFVDGLKH
jgi:hypothetical protein